MKRILVPVDFSDVTNQVIETAEKLARAFESKVILMHCISENPALAAMGELAAMMPTPEAALPGTYPDQYRKLAEITSSLRNNGIDAELLFVSGVIVEKIKAVATEQHADLIIMGSHGHGALYDLLVGTVTEGVLHHVRRRLLIVPSEK